MACISLYNAYRVTCVFYTRIWRNVRVLVPASVAQSDTRPTCDQFAGSGNIILWRLNMKYFLRSFSSFRWFKKGNCQCLLKECAQYWVTVQRTWPDLEKCGYVNWSTRQKKKQTKKQKKKTKKKKKKKKKNGEYMLQVRKLEFQFLSTTVRFCRAGCVFVSV